MAKKKRKKGKRPTRPAGTATSTAETRRGAPDTEKTETPSTAAAVVSNRQARKEQARRERQRRIRAARRRERLRRIARWAAIIGVVGGVVGAIVYVNTRPLLLENAAAAEAAAALGCGGGEGTIEVPANLGGGHLPQGVGNDYPSSPATSGIHAPGVYTAEERVITQPVEADSELEARLVHNLEHGYIIMYYRAEGPQALPDEVVVALGNLANGETKVLVAPYPALPEGTSLAFAAWNKLLECPTMEPGESEDVVQVARGFIEQYRGTSNAPEPQGA